MHIKRISKKYLVIIFILVIALSVLVSLKLYADNLVSQGFKDLYAYRRDTAVEKIKFAQTIWPPLRNDKSYQNILNQINEIEQRPAVLIFLKDNTGESSAQQLIKQIKMMKGVTEVTYISQDEALAKYKEINKNDPALLSLVTPNILPASIEVYVDDFSIGIQIKDFARTKPFVSDTIQAI